MRSHIIMAALLLAPAHRAALLAQDTSTTQMPQRDSIRGYNTPQSTAPRDSLQGDNALVMKIHKINQMEIRAGQLAQRNSSTAKVKSYGQQLVRDHQTADQKITALAQRLGINLPPEGMDSAGKSNQWKNNQQPHDQKPGRDTTQRADQGVTQRGDSMQGHGHDGMQEHQHMMQQMQRLSSLRGAQFDAEFANFMAQGHDKAIKMLEQQQGNVQNADLRTFITSTLPTLRTHLQVAQSLGGSTTATTTSSIQN